MTQTTNKLLSLPTVGGESGTWGGDLNSNTITPLDTMLGGIASIALSSTNYTMSASDIQNLGAKLSGSLLAIVNVYTSNVGFFFVENNCTGAYTVTLQAVTTTNYPSSGSTVGSGIVIPQGVRGWFVSDQSVGIRPAPSWLPSLVLGLSGAFAITETGGTVTQKVSGTTVATLTSSAFNIPVPLNVSDGLNLTVDPITIAEISTPSVPSSGNIQIYGYSGDFLASQTPGGTQYLYGKDPTVQRFTSGSAQTYTPTAGTVRIRVRMVGGGGGGGAAGTNNGTAGNATSFGGWTVNGGGAGVHGTTGAGGAGGTGGTNGTGTLIVRITGGTGDGGQSTGVNNGGRGGYSPFFNGGAAPVYVSAAGTNGVANTGGGGSGAAANGTGDGGGGGGGEYVEFYMTAAQIGASVSYTVGAAANGGAAGTQAGGNGAAGIIIVEEFYN